MMHLSDKQLFEEFSKVFVPESEAIKFAPDAQETLTYRFMYQAFVFGFKAGQRKEIMRQRDEDNSEEASWYEELNRGYEQDRI